MILHGDNRGMMKREALVLDEISERLGGAGVPSGRPGAGILLLLAAEGPSGLRVPRIVRPQATIQTGGVEGSAARLLPEARELGEICVPLVEIVEEVAMKVALMNGCFRMVHLVLKATVAEIICIILQHFHAVHRALILVRRSAAGERGLFLRVFELLRQRGGELMKQLGVLRFLLVVLVVDVHLDALVLRRQEVLVVVLVHAQQGQQSLGCICANFKWPGLSVNIYEEANIIDRLAFARR